MNFPEWAPPDLVEHCQHYLNQQDKDLLYRGKLDKDMLIAITTSPDMERVWNMLYKKRVRYKCDENEPVSFGNNQMALSLFHAIQKAVDKTKQKAKIRSEDVLKYQEIAKSARELAEKVSKSNLDVSPLHWFPIEAFNTMLERDIKPEKAAGYFCLVHDESEFHKKGGIYQEVKLKDLRGNDIFEYWRIAENTKDFFNDCCITTKYPSISAVLKSLATEADTAAKHEATRPRIVNRANISKTTIFIRDLYPFWHETFGGPLYRTLAALCRVVLDDSSIDEDDIKDALKNYKLLL